MTLLVDEDVVHDVVMRPQPQPGGADPQDAREQLRTPRLGRRSGGGGRGGRGRGREKVQREMDVGR